jgi:hypothetical protein
MFQTSMNSFLPESKFSIGAKISNIFAKDIGIKWGVRLEINNK